MANEARVRASLYIRVGKLNYQSQPSDFSADVSEANGPVPGALTVSTTGTNVTFTGLTRPGLCRIMNIDEDNYVEWGIHDGSLFHPIGELLPGEIAVLRLSRNLGVEEDVPGTGTSAVINAFYLRANTASCVVLVEAFET